MKYTRELLEPLVRESTSVMEVMRKLGLVPIGGNHTHISRRIKHFDLDTSHFVGFRSNTGENHRGGPTPVTPEMVLVNVPGILRRAVQLRKALLAIGRVEQCEHCGLGREWRDAPLILQIDHIDGDRCNNESTNLRFLCPNCHSQTDTWGTIKQRRSSPIGRRHVA